MYCNFLNVIKGTFTWGQHGGHATTSTHMFQCAIHTRTHHQFWQCHQPTKLDMLWVFGPSYYWHHQVVPLYFTSSFIGEVASPRHQLHKIIVSCSQFLCEVCFWFPSVDFVRQSQFILKWNVTTQFSFRDIKTHLILKHLFVKYSQG